MEKKPILEKKVNTIQGDTVKCMYWQNKSCSGYVIQGTRRKGNVIHITPKNKNVPIESEEEKAVKK